MTNGMYLPSVSLDVSLGPCSLPLTCPKDYSLSPLSHGVAEPTPSMGSHHNHWLLRDWDWDRDRDGNAWCCNKHTAVMSM